MKVLFDGYWWYSGPASNQMVQRHFIAHWQRRYPEDEVIIAVPGGPRSDDRNTQGATFVSTKLHNQLLINSIELPSISRRIYADCIVAHNFAPISGASVVFIHDVMFMEHSEWFSRIENLYFNFMPRLARFADYIAVSTRSEQLRFRRNVSAKTPTCVTGLGMNDSLMLSTSKKLDVIPYSFVLVVGRLNVRKNLELTISSALRSGTISAEYPLVIVGEGSGADVIRQLGIHDQVRDGLVKFAGFVEVGELKWLYENCSYLACLSLDEGFGLTPVEASHFGAPLLVSDIEVFHETLKKTDVIYVNPRIETDIAKAMVKRRIKGRTRDLQPQIGTMNWDNAVDVLRSAAQGVISLKTGNVSPILRTDTVE